LLCLLPALLLSGLVSCSRHGAGVAFFHSTSPAATMDTVAAAYVRLAVELGERDPDSLDYAVVSPALRDEIHAKYPPLDEISRGAETLLTQLPALETTPALKARGEFLQLQLTALKARTAMLHGQTLEFDREANALFATTRLPDIYAAQRRDLRGQVASLLPPAKHPTGSEADRYAAYDSRFVIPRDRVVAVMQAALAICRRRTLEYIALPSGESVELELVGDKPWSAFSRYLGHAHSLIQLNTDLPITVDDAMELACHEGYPGHHVFNTLRDIALVQQAGEAEAKVQLTFSPQSYVSEAAAAYAPRLAFSTQERAQLERDVLFPIARLNPADAERSVEINSLVRRLDSADPAIARDYIDGRLEYVRAGQEFADEALMANADSLLLYLNEYRSYMLAYTDGPRRIEAYLDTAVAATHPDSPAAERRARWQAYQQLMRTMRFRLPAPSAAQKK
jgi:hypothetical protein